MTFNGENYLKKGAINTQRFNLENTTFANLCPIFLGGQIGGPCCHPPLVGKCTER